MPTEKELQREDELRRRQKERLSEGQLWVETRKQFDVMTKALEIMPFNERMMMAKKLSDQWRERHPDGTMAPVERTYVSFFAEPDLEVACDIADLLPDGPSSAMTRFMEMVGSVMPKPKTEG